MNVQKNTILSRSPYGVAVALLVALVFMVPGLDEAIAISEADCRKCHGTVVETHHTLVATEGKECLDCHRMVTDPDTGAYDPEVVRNCLGCHSPSPHRHGLYLSSRMTLPGVLPVSAPEWTQYQTFLTKNPATAQFQVCVRCHSSYTFGTVPNGVTSIIGPSGIPLTDVAMEFNPANGSAHAVMATLNNQVGSPYPRPLAKFQMTSAWQNVGKQTMLCGDCHQASTATASAGLVLKGTGKYWPTKPDGTLYRLIETDVDANLFCRNCHPLFDRTTGKWFNDAHKDMEKIKIKSANSEVIACVHCHVAIPHGSKRSRLIGYGTDPAPYNYGGNSIRMYAFRKSANPNDYSTANCFSLDAIGCSVHKDKSGTYEP